MKPKTKEEKVMEAKVLINELWHEGKLTTDHVMILKEALQQ